jgi:hypothetical protein
MDHLLKDPEMPAPTGRLWFGGVRICMRVGRVRLTHLDLYIFNMKELIFQSRGVCGKSVKYVGSHNGIHDMTRAGESRLLH